MHLEYALDSTSTRTPLLGNDSQRATGGPVRTAARSLSPLPRPGPARG
jgi:hypothetical protein